MPASREQLEELVNFPRESLNVELKEWIDPTTPQGKAKVICTALALRNHNGGFLLIGFEDETRRPATSNRPADPVLTWNGDDIQQLISVYSSVVFEVLVSFVDRDGIPYPVIEIPAGVLSPVAAKKELPDPASSSKPLVRLHGVYVRTLAVNNTPSTSLATWRDWPDLVDRCFQNREADIGGFIRRQLAGVNLVDALRGALAPREPQEDTEQAATTLLRIVDALRGAVAPRQSQADTEQAATMLLHRGHARFLSALGERQISEPGFGSWEVAAVVRGPAPVRHATEEFLTLLDSSNPDLTGWPIWLNPREFQDRDSRPYVADNAWEALINGHHGRPEDFWRLEPTGRFYLWRVLQDDVSTSRPESGLHLDFGLVILRVAEVLVVALRFARALEFDSEQTTVAFAFRWRGLAGRELSNWANRARRIRGSRTARQNEVLSEVIVPLSAAESALAPFVADAVRPLFAVFDGWEVSDSVVEELTRRLVERRL